jgi:galactose mutarotase-like enzyme
MKKRLSNSELSISVESCGAELSSLAGVPDGIEYLWQADPAIWSRHAPVLFPIVGKLKGDDYTWNGRRYSLSSHGFARDLEFECIRETDDVLSFRLLPSDETRACYPFEFSLVVTYLLVGATVEVRYEVMNLGEGTMPFSIGAHPGFSLDWGENDRIEDYYLQFEQEETLTAHYLGDDILLSGETGTVLERSRTFPITQSSFDRNSLIFMERASDRIELCSHKHPQRVTIEFPRFPHFAVWAQPGAPYICVEPWFGHADRSDSCGDIRKKPGINFLETGATFECFYRISVSTPRKCQHEGKQEPMANRRV